MLGAWCGSDCIFSWVDLFTLLFFNYSLDFCFCQSLVLSVSNKTYNPLYFLVLSVSDTHSWFCQFQFHGLPGYVTFKQNYNSMDFLMLLASNKLYPPGFGSFRYNKILWTPDSVSFKYKNLHSMSISNKVNNSTNFLVLSVSNKVNSSVVVLSLLNKTYNSADFLHLTIHRFNPNKPGVPFVGHRQTVQTQIRHCIKRRLIRVFTVCL